MIITDEIIEELSQQLQNFGNPSETEHNEEVIDTLFSIMDEVLSQQNLDTEALANGTIFIVGITGAGKSTLLNYLAGKELLVYSDMGVIKLKLKNPEDGISSIGTGTGQSETLYPIVYSDLETDITYVDNPGDEDSRGIAQQILNSYLKYNVAKELSKIQMLIVASQSSIINDNATTFVSYLNRFESIFVNSELINKNVSLVITRADMSYNDMKLNLENVLKYQETNLGAAKPILENIINNRRFGLFLQPTRDQVDQVYVSPINEYGVGMEGIISMLKDTNYAITPGKDLFKPVVSDTETIRRIIENDKSSKRLCNEIISSIKNSFLEKIATHEDVENFYDTFKYDPIISDGEATKEQLINFFKNYFNKDITTNSDFKKIEFFNTLLGLETFTINLGSLYSRFEELKIYELLNMQPVATYDSESNIFFVNGFFIRTSFLLSELEKHSEEINHIEIQSINKLFFDQDLTSLSCCKLSIIAPTWDITGSSKELKLIGRDALNHTENKAPNGNNGMKGPEVLEGNGKDGEPGGNGADGAPGNNGGSGGSFLGYANKVIFNDNTLKIISKGGNGSRGQDGGDGGKGGDGSNGTRYVPKRTKGGLGGVGGNGGKGGAGGKGGPPGVIEFNLASESIVIESIYGNDSTNGVAGNFNLGGRHGYGWSYIPGVAPWSANCWKKHEYDPNTAANGTTPTELNPALDVIAEPSIEYDAFIRYDNFLASFFDKKDISKDVALAVLLNFIKPLEEQMSTEVKKYSKIRRYSVFKRKSTKSVSLTNSLKLGNKGLIDEFNFINTLYSQYLDGSKLELSAQDLFQIFDRFLLKIEDYASSQYALQDEIDRQVLLSIYSSALSASSTLKSSYTIVNLDYIDYLLNNLVLEYDQIIKSEKLALENKEYENQIEVEIQNANEYISDLETSTIYLIDLLNGRIELLEQSLQAAQEAWEDYVERIQSLGNLKVFATILNLAGSIASFFGPVGQVIGGLSNIPSTVVNMLGANLKPLTMSQLSPATYITLNDANEKVLDIEKFIEVLVDKDLELNLSSDELREEAAKGHGEFIGKYRTILKDKHSEIANSLQQLSTQPNENYEELKKEYNKYNSFDFATGIADTVKAAQNIVTSTLECMTILDKVDAALAGYEQFKKSREEIENFIDDHIDGLINSMKAFSSSLELADSHAKIDYLTYELKEEITSIIDYFQNALKFYDYPDKGNLFSVLNKFDRVSETMAKLYDRIEDALDKKRLAEYITNTADPKQEIYDRYPNFIDLYKNIQSNVVKREANTVLYSLKQSQFPRCPYYSYDFYNTALGLTNTDISVTILAIKDAYENRTLSKYAIQDYEKHIVFDGEFDEDIKTSKGSFSIFLGVEHKAKIAALLLGYDVYFIPEIRWAPKGADAIKLKEINIKFKLKPDSDEDEVHPMESAFISKLEEFRVELSSSGDYYYRYDNKCYNIPSSTISVSYNYAGDSPNVPYEKIKSGDPIFSPYSRWKIKLLPIRGTTPTDILYREFANYISNMELHLVGKAQYIDMYSFSGATNTIQVNKCYESFIINPFQKIGPSSTN